MGNSSHGKRFNRRLSVNWKRNSLVNTSSFWPREESCQNQPVRPKTKRDHSAELRLLFTMLSWMICASLPKLSEREPVSDLTPPDFSRSTSTKPCRLMLNTNWKLSATSTRNSPERKSYSSSQTNSKLIIL